MHSEKPGRCSEGNDISIHTDDVFGCSSVCNVQSPKDKDCFEVLMKQVQKLKDQSSSTAKDTEESLQDEKFFSSDTKKACYFFY